MALWQWRELCEALDLPAINGPDITGISIDSRITKPGDLFIALTGDPGTRFNPSYRSERDGHDFIAAAIRNGAAGVLVHDRTARDIPQLQVADTLDGLWALGRAARKRFNGQVVAITGSSGKTTCKSFLAAALGAFATEGSLNNHLGVPLSLARTPHDAPVAVYEIGTNHPGEIAPLAGLVRPHVAVVLNVHPAHRENFADMRELLKEKLSIAAGLGARGSLVLEESLEAPTLPPGITITRFGRQSSNTVQLMDAVASTAHYALPDRLLTGHIPGGGAHRAITLAAVLGVLVALREDPERALDLPDSLVPAGRGREIDVGGITVIDDSYNANPESMAAALRMLNERRADTAERQRGVFAVLGEMLELGADGPRYHAELAPLCQSFDGIFCVGHGMLPLRDTLHQSGIPVSWQAVADDVLIEAIVARVGPGDLLLVKGSNRVFWAQDFVRHLTRRLASG